MENRKKCDFLPYLIVAGVITMFLGNGAAYAQLADTPDPDVEKKLTKLSLKMKFAENDIRKKQTAGPAYFKCDEKNAEDITTAFLKRYASDYGMDPTLKDIEVTKVQKTPGGTIVRFRQVIDDIPVHMSNGSITVNNENTVTWANLLYRPEARKKDKAFAAIKSRIIDGDQAEKTASEYIGLKGDPIAIPVKELNWFEHESDGVLLAWKVVIDAHIPFGEWEVFINAETGTVVQVQNMAYHATGSGMVFNPDPLKSANVPYGGSFVDNGDADNATLNAERQNVTLQDITLNTGMYSLMGSHCTMAELGGLVDAFPVQASSAFNFTRSQDEFEDVMCYFHIDNSARYVLQLGYYQHGLDSMAIDPHGEFSHNGTFWPGSNNITLGDWDVDAGEDAGIILHEYGHAIEHNVGPGLTHPSGEPRAVMEGCSDFWDVSYGASLTNYAWARHGFWFGEGHGRPCDTTLAYPTQAVMYEAAPIWSSALMNIWWATSKSVTDTLFLQMLSQIPPDVSMSGAAMAFIDADYNLYGGAHRDEILNSFDAYGLVQNINTIPYTDVDSLMVPPNQRFDDWNVYGNDGADNEYFLHLDNAAVLNFTTCSPTTNFDTKIEIFNRNGGTTGYFNNDDATCGANPQASTLNNVNLAAGDYYVIIDGNNGDVGRYELSIDYTTPPVSLEVYILDEGYYENNIVKPRFYIVNNGASALSDFTMRYYFTAEFFKLPVIDDYWTPYCSSYLQWLGGGSWCAVFDFNGYTLPAGGRVPENSGQIVGIRYTDWSTFNKSNDYSQPPSNSYTLTNNVAIFNDLGVQVYGTTP